MTLGEFIQTCIDKGAELDTEIGYRDMNFGGLVNLLEASDIHSNNVIDHGMVLLLDSRFFAELD